MSGIKVKRVDTISAQTPVPASLEETRTFLGLLQNAAAQGYQIKGATAIETGQRDPYTVGMRIVMEREAPQ